MAENDSNPTPPAPAAVTEKDKDTPPPPLAADVESVKEVAENAAESENDIDVKASTSEDAVVVAQPQEEETSDKQQPPPPQESDPEQQQQQNHKIPQNLASFKVESNRVSDLSDSERKALEDLKNLLTDALNTSKQTPKEEGDEGESDASTEIKPPSSSNESHHQQVSIWGVPLLQDDRTDVILLKFLRARDFRVKEALTMLNSTLKWRKEFNIDALVDEDLGDDLDKVVFMHGHSREGHPVCYNVYGEFQNKELYQKAFSNEERRTKFLRWRIQFLEKSIRKLDFSPTGINTLFQVNDLKNSPGPGKRDLRLATKQALQLLQDNYPEFVAKQVFINVPWWYLAFYTMISPFLTQRTKSKFVFAGPSKSPDTLFKYISPEQVPVQYGGLSVDFCDCNPDFSMSDPVTEIPIKPTTKQTVEIAIYEKCIIVWELRVVGWEVSYCAEFKPDAEDGYTVIIHKPTKMSPTDEPVVSNSFKVGELGKLLLTIDNPTMKKKRLLYRFTIKPYTD